MRSTFLAFVMSGIIVSVPGPPALAQTTSPNVVVIMLDDGRKDHLETMPKTEALLVDHGTSFGNAIVADPLCCPSRASYMRGQYAHTTSVYNVQFEFGGWAQYKEAKIERQMLNVWFDATHFTALVGKYTNGYNGVAPPGPAGSWDYLAAFLKVGYAPGTWTTTNGSVRTTPAQYSTDYMTARSVDAIRTSGAEPVFLWTAYYAPHNPFTPPARYDSAAEAPQCESVDLRDLPSFNEAGKQLDSAQPGLTDKPRWLKNGRTSYSASKQLAKGVTDPRQQCRSLLAVDDGVQQIVAALEAKDPGLDDTIIVFTSDQGVQNGQHNYVHKQVPYEETVNVPLVVRAAGLLGGAASTRSEMVANIDLAPTLLDLAGLPQVQPGCAQTGDVYQARCEQLGRGGFDGYSFAPLLRGQPYVERNEILMEHWDPATPGNVPTFCGVRTRSAKLVRYVLAGTTASDWEAYNLASDPAELNSLAYSGTDGVVKFRPGGQAIYDALAPRLIGLCDPRPPGYPGW